MKYVRQNFRTWFVFILLVLPLSIFSQVLLQLEIPHEVEAIKFSAGNTLKFKQRSFPDVWQVRVINKILLEENVLIMEDGMVDVSDIAAVQLVNSTASGLGKLFTGFGGGWLLFGGIASVASDYKFTWGTALIGVFSGGLGLILSKFIAKKTYKIGKNANLRIIDISFPEPLGVQKDSMKIQP